MKTLPSFARLALCLLVPRVAARAEPTAPVGFVAYTLPATTSGEAASYVSAPLSMPVAYNGTASAVGANTLTAAGVNWTDDQWKERPYYVHVTTGAQAGRTLAILANTGAQLTVDVTDDSADATALDADGFALAAGDGFEIVPARTLGNVFGDAADTLQLTGGSDANSADRVGVWSGRGGGYTYYYYNTTAGHWARQGASAATDGTDTVLTPTAALALVRPGRGASGRVILAGAPAAVAPLVKAPGGDVTRYSGLGLPVDVQLYQLDPGIDWKRKKNPAKADLLAVYKTSRSKWISYCQQKSGNWVKPGGADPKNTVVVAAGGTVGFTRHQGLTGAASFLKISLPYTP